MGRVGGGEGVESVSGRQVWACVTTRARRCKYDDRGLRVAVEGCTSGAPGDDGVGFSDGIKFNTYLQIRIKLDNRVFFEGVRTILVGYNGSFIVRYLRSI